MNPQNQRKKLLQKMRLNIKNVLRFCGNDNNQTEYYNWMSVYSDLFNIGVSFTLDSFEMNLDTSRCLVHLFSLTCDDWQYLNGDLSKQLSVARNGVGLPCAVCFGVGCLSA